MRYFAILFALVFSCATLYSEQSCFDPNSKWAKMKLASMSLDEKIGQLFIVGAYSNSEDAVGEGQTAQPIEYVEEMIEKYHVGGVLFKCRWNPLLERHYVTHFQNLSSTFLFTMQDLEWGLEMRMSTALRFAKNMTLGAVQNTKLIYELGKEIGREAKIVGINVNLAPCVDVNSNPENPIIGDRSFGSNPASCGLRGQAYMEGLMESGVVACAKHFPGHGNTDKDSHLLLPVIKSTKSELQNCDLIPFKSLIEAGVPLVMTAHIVLSDESGVSDNGLPATFSKKIVTTLLKEELGFQGLCITDDLLMKSIADTYGPKAAPVLAFKAGCDLIISSKDIAESSAAIKAAIGKEIKEEELNARVLKILQLKEWLLRRQIPPSPPLFSKKAKELKYKLYESAICWQNPQNNFQSAAAIQIGGGDISPFNVALGLDSFYLGSDSTQKERQKLAAQIDSYPSYVVPIFDLTRKYIVAVSNTNRPTTDFWGLKTSTRDFIELLREKHKPILFVIFGSPYLKKFFYEDDSILFAFEDDPDAQKAASDIILNEKTAQGVLPIQMPSLAHPAALPTQEGQSP